MQFDTKSRNTMRSTANWGLALSVVMLLSCLVGLGGLFEGSWKWALLTIAWTVVDALCALALASASLALRQVPTDDKALEGAFGALRSHFRMHALMVLVFPVVVILVVPAMLLAPLVKHL